MDSEYEIFEVIPVSKEYGNRPRIHLGGTCEYLKIYWWEGKPGNSGIKKYFMKKIPNKVKNENAASGTDAQKDARLF